MAEAIEVHPDPDTLLFVVDTIRYFLREKFPNLSSKFMELSIFRTAEYFRESMTSRFSNNIEIATKVISDMQESAVSREFRYMINNNLEISVNSFIKYEEDFRSRCYPSEIVGRNFLFYSLRIMLMACYYFSTGVDAFSTTVDIIGSAISKDRELFWRELGQYGLSYAQMNHGTVQRGQTSRKVEPPEESSSSSSASSDEIENITSGALYRETSPTLHLANWRQCHSVTPPTMIMNQLQISDKDRTDSSCSSEMKDSSSTCESMSVQGSNPDIAKKGDSSSTASSSLDREMSPHSSSKSAGDGSPIHTSLGKRRSSDAIPEVVPSKLAHIAQEPEAIEEESRESTEMDVDASVSILGKRGSSSRDDEESEAEKKEGETSEETCGPSESKKFKTPEKTG